MISAVTYAALVGKYVRMERQPDEVEWAEHRADHGGVATPGWMVGCEGLVAYVYDSNHRVGGPSVEIVMDYGMGYAIFECEEWFFHIWPDEETARLWSQTGEKGEENTE